MKKGILALIIVGASLFTIGTALFVTGLVVEKLNRKPITNTYEITEEVKNFNIDISTADLEFKVAEDGVSKVVCNERENEHHEVVVADNTLSIKYKDDLPWYKRWFDLNSNKMNVTIYLPGSNYENLTVKSSTSDININKEYSFADLDIKLSTGDIKVYSDVTNKLKAETTTGNVSINEVSTSSIELKASTGKLNLNKVDVTGDITLTTSTGNMNLEEVTAANLTTNCSTGEVKLNKVTLVNNLNIKTSTGDIVVVDSDANEVNLEASTGDVNAIFLTSKIVYATSSTGNVDVPHSTSGGLCNIKTSTGDIVVRIK